MTISETTGAVTLTVTHDGFDYPEGRARFMSTIRVGDLEYHDDGINGPATGEADERQAFYSLVSFLKACDESRTYGGGENANLFPRWIMEALAPHIEDVQYVGMDPDEWPDSHFRGETDLIYNVTDFLFEEGRALPYGCAVEVPLIGDVTTDDRDAIARILRDDCWHEIVAWDTLDESNDRGYTEIVLEWVA